MFYEKTSNGIKFTDNIISCEGAAFVLYPDPHHSQKEIEAAENEIRHKRDVVRMHVATPDDLDYAYKSDIFDDPRTKPLKWYEINQDEKLIREERLKGTNPTDFVTNYVLPYIEETHRKNLAKYGL